MNCYNCKNRTPGCHSTCEVYRINKEKTDLAKKNRHEETNFKRYLHDAVDNMQKIQKK